MSMYSKESRELQDQFDTRRLADRIEGLLVKDQISDDTSRFLERVDMFFLATADAEGRPSCSYKGGAPGFVRVVDEQTLAFPSYDGNGMYLSLGNLSANPHVGMLFIDFENGHRMRINGDASIDPKDPLLADYPEAQLVVRVRVREVFPNCPRYIHKMKRVESSPFVPKQGKQTPVPGWKRSGWACDALPEHDPARDPKKPVR